MCRSRLPDASVCAFHAMVPTRAVCSAITRIFLHVCASQICTSPALVPTARCVPRCVHETDVMQSSGPRSHSFVTLLVHALHRYTQLPSPTASTLSDDQSTRFR